MRIPPLFVASPFVCLALYAQTTAITVGQGAPTVQIQQSFQSTFFQNNFNNLVTLPPLGLVKALGSRGLVQEFAGAANSSQTYALCKPNVNQAPLANDGDMVQFYPSIYSYYTTVGTTTAGYPTTSTMNCPNLVSVPGNTCQYQLFDAPAALFAYSAAIGSAGSDFSVVSPFYAPWQALGGIATAGPATSSSQNITSASAVTATLQTFDQAAIFSITSGNLSGSLITVGPLIYPTYSSNGGYSGFLGLPIGPQQVLPNGNTQQIFEGGSIVYSPANSSGTAYRAVNSITIAPAVTSLQLNLGATTTLSATVYDGNGNVLTNQTVAWSTSNSQVVSIKASGGTATLTAVGGGTASIAATSGGKVSPAIVVSVSAPCCALGAGSPTPAIQQAFQQAVTANHLTIQTPIPAPVRRLGSGYVQNVQDVSGNPYLIAVPDGSSIGYAVGGALLATYTALGGPTGTLGYPASNPTAGGRQLFQNQAALAGNPVQVVSGTILQKWAALNYEAGAAGSPTSGVSSFLTFQATQGSLQSFQNGEIVSAQTGSNASQAYFVSGLVLAAYNQAGGPGGSLGLPTDDQYANGGTQQQDFEGGSVGYAVGAMAAQVTLGNRQPLVAVTPGSVIAGSAVQIAIGGFNAGATVRVSVSGQPDFVVTTATGAYTWQSVVPANATAGTVSIKAADTASGATAAGAYTIRVPSQVHFVLSKVSGDAQNGLPGAALPQPLVVLLKDDQGNPAPGIAVTFSSSPGSQVVSASPVTDASGSASAVLRLPTAEGIMLASAAAGGQVVTFSAQAAHGSLAAYPIFNQANFAGTLGGGADTIAAKGALLASAASILRYYQNNGSLPRPNGFADPQVLDQFLKSFCVSDPNGNQICDGFISPPGSTEQFVNLWRLPAFAGGGLTISVLQPDVSLIRDSLAQGAPVLIALSMSLQGDSAGGHYVVAEGVAPDGSILIMDPNPAFGQANLNNYLNGFSAAGGTWTGKLAGVVRIRAATPSSTGFLVAGTATFQLTSAAGASGVTLDLPGIAATPGTSGAAGVPDFLQRFCDGAQSLYELDETPSGQFDLTLTDLATPGNHDDLLGSGPASFQISRPGVVWTAVPETLSFAANAIVNAASFTPDIAPGGLFTVFGSGLSLAGGTTSVQINGEAVSLVAQTPFQISGPIPSDLSPGSYPFAVSSPFGSASQSVTIQAVAPEIFQLTGGGGAILNQNGSLNTPATPASRGSTIVIYCTGLGAVAPQGSLSVATTPASAVLNGTQLPVAYAGLAPGFVGLYQVNLAIPVATPPGTAIPLSIQQGGIAGNSVKVAIQ
jgi:uncharacterized protein (TIGR03437 family)